MPQRKMSPNTRLAEMLNTVNASDCCETNVHEILLLALNSVLHQVRDQCAVRTTLVGGLPKVFGYPEQLYQAFCFLLSTASAVAGENGGIVIDTVVKRPQVVVRIRYVASISTSSLPTSVSNTSALGDGDRVHQLEADAVQNIITQHGGAIRTLGSPATGLTVVVCLPLEGAVHLDLSSFSH